MNLVHADHHESRERKAVVGAISQRVESLVDGPSHDSEKTPVSHFGNVACVKELRLRLVPFFEPSVIFVLSGAKRLGNEGVGEGGCLAIPAPANYHMANEPNPDTGYYQALVFPFTSDDVDHVRALLTDGGKVAPRGCGLKDIVTYEFDADTLDALDHYLRSGVADSPVRVQHRKREILLILAERDPRILSLTGGTPDWTQRLRTLFSEDPAHAWPMTEVCNRVVVTESTLRRKLRKEGTSFREVLSEFRLGNALMEILMSSAPIYQVAHDNGFQSVSRFTENFHKRFGATPSDVRNRLPEIG